MTLQTGLQTVQKRDSLKHTKCLILDGEPGRNRTCDPLIKRHAERETIQRASSKPSPEGRTMSQSTMDPVQTEKPARRTRGTGIHSVRDQATGAVRNYYREPRGHMLPPGVGKRLPDDAGAAILRARELDALCLPWRIHSHPETVIRVAVDELVGSILTSAKKRAKRHGLAFDLTEADITELLQRQIYRCAVSGIKFQATAGKDAGSYRGAFRPSPDRIKAKLGYVRGNVRLVLVAVNVALSDWGDAQLIEIARAIAAQHPMGGVGMKEAENGR
jgi:hypothetical protein